MYQPSQSAHQRNKDRQDGDADLTRSLQRLAISATPSPSSTPRSPRPSSAMRSPLRSTSASVVPSSRSATPALLRKASMNSLHSVSGVTPARRASFAALSSPGGRPRSGRSPLRSASPELPEKPIPTPHSVASAHFKAELDIHHGPEPTRRAETVVVLQDACYGHRYSRPRASRTQLSTIVERPERIKACVLGVSAAYVRLGERHQDGAFPLSPDSDAASLPSIPFRIQKSTRRLSLSSQTVTNVHGTRWMEELRMMCDAAEAKLAGGGKELQRPDIDRGPNVEAPQKFHEGDLYLCSESLEAMEGALGGVCDAVDAVFRPEGPRRAFVAIRPPGHHCSASHPSGFCWINNVHVGIMHAVLSHGLTHAAIIDFDLHHGDGSQSIAWQHNARGVTLAKNAAWWKRTSIGYFSLHDINSYPCEMGDEDKVRNASICIDGAHGQSVWNVHLEPWETEADFWALYESKYAVLLEKTRTYLKRHTERLRASGLHSRAAIFLSAGFDASEHEGVGMQRHNVNVPTDFYARFTRDVVRIAAEEGTSVEGRIVSVLEGGYSDRALCSGVFSHLCGLAGDGPSRDEESTNGYEAIQKGDHRRARKDSTASERGARRYESSWWSRAQLDMLDEAIRTPPPVPKPVRNSPPPTYSSPTQASQAKVVTLKNRRSISGLSSIASNGVRRFSYEPPPSPDVPWTIATHELSKLLIPSGRQTTSCTAEDLNAEATRVRRERQAALAGSVLAVAAPAPEDRAPTRMSLRERKTKPAYTFDDDELDRKLRRKTVAGPTVHAADTASRGPTPAPGKQPKTARRLSAASSLASSEGKDSLPSASRPASVRATSATDVTSGPEPAMSAAEPKSSNLNVKKTRVPVKKEPVLRASRALKKQSAPANGALQQAPGSATAAATGPSTEKARDEMDKLAGEMKKIKITVLTKAQKEARERERAIREKFANAETISVAPPQAAEKGSQPQPAPPTDTAITNTTATLPSPSPSPAHEHPQLQSPTDPSTFPPQEAITPTTNSNGPLASPPTTDPRSIPLPTSSPPPPRAMSSPLGEVPTTAPNNFIPYQPDGPTPKPTAPHPQQLQWLPPNVSATPVQSPARRENLPVFTSTSVIPFAMGPTARGAGVNGRAGEGGTKGADSAEGSS
ncbi:uncharacterized protein B0T15DRAFT_394603 [Chaetomium strumarium]|uniref:Histone deacetylase domain-containing protein n=1 Tax=Chaetomium strumarium TaxID=1170767 RepID=A0AAJ0GWU3_9PEZI|nr:hypothetical protein B0T15DRAFT_394603 [Chaetomium strumarium]